MTRAGSSNKTQRSGGASSGKTTGKGRSTAKGRSTTQRSTTTQSSSRQSSAESKEASHGTTVELPFVTARFHTPDLSLPSGEDMAATAHKVRNQLPSIERTLFLGALTLGVAFAWIEWPVALVIGVGTAMTHQSPAHNQKEHASAG